VAPPRKAAIATWRSPWPFAGNAGAADGIPRLYAIAGACRRGATLQGGVRALSAPPTAAAKLLGLVAAQSLSAIVNHFKGTQLLHPLEPRLAPSIAEAHSREL